MPSFMASPRNVLSLLRNACSSARERTNGPHPSISAEEWNTRLSNSYCWFRICRTSGVILESKVYLRSHREKVPRITQLQANKTLNDGVFRQRDGGVEVQLVHNAELMELDGLDRDIEQRGDLFRPPSFRD